MLLSSYACFVFYRLIVIFYLCANDSDVQNIFDHIERTKLES